MHPHPVALVWHVDVDPQCLDCTESSVTAAVLTDNENIRTPTYRSLAYLHGLYSVTVSLCSTRDDHDLAILGGMNRRDRGLLGGLELLQVHYGESGHRQQVLAMGWVLDGLEGPC